MGYKPGSAIGKSGMCSISSSSVKVETLASKIFIASDKSSYILCQLLHHENVWELSSHYQYRTPGDRRHIHDFRDVDDVSGEVRAQSTNHKR